MAGTDWTDVENDLIVADYFAMLQRELAGRAYNKSQHRRALLPMLQDRSEGSVEFKHQNISAVLASLGETWINGYKPLFNFQTPLEFAVTRWLNTHPEWTHRIRPNNPQPSMMDLGQIWIDPAPTLSNHPPPDELEKRSRIARKFNVAERDERNRLLGKAGEERVFQNEKLILKANGRDDLASKVRWVSEEDGDGAGYDISSFAPDGAPRLIEVKTTNGDQWTPFYISRNELEVSGENREHWRIFRLWNFSRTPRAFEIAPPLERHVSLVATSYQASFN